MNDKAQNSYMLMTRSEVTPGKNYREYREILRIDFLFSCAYCTMTEIEAMGIGFQIDHYLPQKVYPDLKNNYQNLMWSCSLCNSLKRSYAPSVEGVRKGKEILRPDKDDFSKHVELEGYRLKGLSHKGEFTIEYIYLNRKQLRTLREYRERISNASAFIAHGIKTLRNFSIDKITNPRNRFMFIEIRKRVFDQHKIIIDSTEELIKKFAKSELLDEDPNKKQHLKNRAKFLKEQKAISI